MAFGVVKRNAMSNCPADPARKESIMKIARQRLFAATVATATRVCIRSGSVRATTCGANPRRRSSARATRQSYRMRVGTKIEGHLTEPVYLVDHVAVPADSKVFGTITGKHSVSRQVRTAAMFNGDLTPLKDADVTFSELETPDGRI